MKAILPFIFLLFVFSGAGRQSVLTAQASQSPQSMQSTGVIQAGLRAPLADISIDCNTPNMPPGYNFQVIPEHSGTQAQAGSVLHSFLCNYSLKTASANARVSGLAITIDYRCPSDTQQTWTSITSSRPTEVSRTSNSLLLREDGDVSGYAGSFTVMEKLFLQLDTHTIATIVVLTDPDAGSSGGVVFSADAARPIASSLASAYASQANDPACGAPPGPAAGNQNQSAVNIGLGVAVAVSVGAGVAAALFGGVLGGIAGSSSALGAVASGAPSSFNAMPGQQPTPIGSPGSQASQTAPGSLAPVTIQTNPAPAGGMVGVPASLAVPIPHVPPVPPGAQVVIPATVLAPPVLAAGAAVAAAMPSATENQAEKERGQDDKGKDESEEKACPEAQAYLFGLPSLNTRKDCPGTRPDMGQWCAGIDFTSNDPEGRPAMLDFEACVSGEVTHAGGGAFNMIEVTLENGNRIQYLHASEVYVKLEQRVGSSTKLGRTGGTGPARPDQYELHLHIQAIDKHGDMIDPDCAIASLQNRILRISGSPSPHRQRMERESKKES